MSDLKRYTVTVALTKDVVVYAPSNDGVTDIATCMVLDSMSQLDLEGNLLEDVTIKAGEPQDEE